MNGSDRDEESVDGADEPADVGVESDDKEWAFTLEDIERREAEREAAERAAAERARPLEPGDPSLEGTIFVLFGAAIALFALSRLFVA